VLVIPATTPSSSTVTYTVKPGDTLYKIAATYGTTVSAIVAANNIPNPNLIYPGQVFVIPAATPTATIRYTVVPGDTLYRIALKYSTTVSAIVLANNIANPNLIYPGQVLIIPR